MARAFPFVVPRMMIEPVLVGYVVSVHLRPLQTATRTCVRVVLFERRLLDRPIGHDYTNQVPI